MHQTNLFFLLSLESCPEGKKSDLSTFYQNRAAAYEQLENDEAVGE